jgi:hypothetical protein
MEKELKKINAKLNVLIGILIDMKSENNKVPEKDVFRRLSDLGMENVDIGKIFGKTSEQVSKQLYETKRKKGK